MSTNKQVILHVGLHKTGTSSIQEFLKINHSKLLKLDINLYQGLYFPTNHVELHLASMRSNRDSPFKLDNNINPNNKYIDIIKCRVRAFFENSDQTTVLFSSDGLSYLKFADEFANLKQILLGNKIEIILYVRNLDGFKKSYIKELKKHKIPHKISE